MQDSLLDFFVAFCVSEQSCRSRGGNNACGTTWPTTQIASRSPDVTSVGSCLKGPCFVRLLLISDARLLNRANQ